MIDYLTKSVPKVRKSLSLKFVGAEFNLVCFFFFFFCFFGIRLVIVFCSGTSVVLIDILGISGCHNSLFLSSPYL